MFYGLELPNPKENQNGEFEIRNHRNDHSQGLSHDLETGYPQLAIVIFWGVLLFYGRQHYTQITTMHMHFLIRIKHNNHIQYHGNYIEVK